MDRPEYEDKRYIDKQFKKMQADFFPHSKPSRKDDNPWEDIAHELAWAIGVVEEEPFRIKSWHRLFNVLKRYEAICREHSR